MTRLSDRSLLALAGFMCESNRIEGIDRYPMKPELDAAAAFLPLEQATLAEVLKLQDSIAPGKPLRSLPGMDVRVGPFRPDPGGPSVVDKLENLLFVAHIEGADAWMVHCVFQQIHPFMDGNGRTGRLLWAWQMRRSGKDPFSLPFLHRFYYQTLESVDARVGWGIKGHGQ